MASRATLRLTSAVLIGAAAVAAWLSLHESEQAAPGMAADPSPSRARGAASESRPRRTLDPTPRRSSPHPAARAPAKASCEPFVSTDCYAGDVWWFDSCGQVEAIDRDCGAGFCRDGVCVEEDWVSGCREPPHGRCEGDVLRLCNAGRDFGIDCGAGGRVCRMGPEGAGCFDRPDEGACDFEQPRCRGDVLERCVRGALAVTACDASGGRCIALGDRGASCLVEAAPAETLPECGPCGCPGEPNGSAEACNGVDDDADGLIDEGAPCGPVLVDALVGRGDYGEPIVDELDLAAELERTNAIFADSGSQIRFELGSVSELELDDPERVDFERLVTLLRPSARLSPETELRVRVVFARHLLEGEVPRLGVAVPFVSEGCGDVLGDRGQRLDEALVAVAEARTRTTLAHELGHHLGLCHTHERDRPGRRPAVGAAENEPLLCGRDCSFAGDAVCDTPPDDEACRYDPSTCGAVCPGGERPDTGNVMSYYHACRERFSSDQVALMEHVVALRRGWARCRGHACSCSPGRDDCPVGMSCRPMGVPGAAFACGMDGSQGPGEDCVAQAECGAATFCLSALERSACVRPCSGSAPGCHCASVPTLGLAFCSEDLGLTLE